MGLVLKFSTKHRNVVSLCLVLSLTKFLVVAISIFCIMPWFSESPQFMLSSSFIQTEDSSMVLFHHFVVLECLYIIQQFPEVTSR
jgi:hypothetical protein